MKILLASKSPRRRKLVETFGLEVAIVDVEVVEVVDPSLPVAEVAGALARTKADGYDSSLLKPDEILLTADTVVVVDERVMGKPHGRDQAVAMLHSLSGKTHTVYTGVCLRSPDRDVLFTERTDVHFKTLSDGEIIHYVDTFKPFDKAGAYGIQEWIGMIGIDRIEGDFYNVMGLPVAHTYQVLCNMFNLIV